jgi:hypothetical protein
MDNYSIINNLNHQRIIILIDIYMGNYIGNYMNNSTTSLLTIDVLVAQVSTQQVKEYIKDIETHDINFIFETKQRPTRANDDTENIKKDLDEVGYCILKGLEGHEDSIKIYNQIVRDIQHFLLKSSETVDDFWQLYINAEKIKKIPRTNGGIVSAYERFYHTRGQWMIRSHPILLNAVSNILQTTKENLICSFDTIGMRWAPEIIKESQDRLHSHIDQALSDTEFRYYQGLYTVTDSSKEEDGGLCVYPSSHRLHGLDLALLLELNQDETFLYYPDKLFEYFPKLQPLKLNINAGNFVLWDSRTAHGSIPISPERNKVQIEPDNLLVDVFKYNRLVQYICYSQRNKSTEEQLDIREEAYMNGYGTNHMANDPRIIEIVSFTDLNEDEYVNEYHKGLI